MGRAFPALVSAAALAGSVSISTRETGDRIKVEVVGRHSIDGDVKCAPLNCAEGFPADSEKAIKTTRGPIHDGISVYDFAQVPAGEWGIAFCHGENSKGKLDRNFLGIPTEGVSASNNVQAPSVRPRFNRAGFACSGVKAVTTHIRYL